jgi:hypothetical protein
LDATQIKRAGFWTGTILVLLGLGYLGLVIALLFSGAGFPPVEPYLTAFNLLILFTAVVIAVFWTIVDSSVPPGKKLFSHVSLVFIVIFVTLTSINRYVGLTVVRQSISAGVNSGLQWFLPYSWPSVMLALEYLGWGFFFGLGCLSLALVFSAGKLERAISWVLVATGLLSLLATLGQVLGSSALKFDLFTMAGVLGWGPGLTIAVALITAWFYRQGIPSVN